MEEVCIRFPHVIEQINKGLDFKTLVKFKEASRIVCSGRDGVHGGHDGDGVAGVQAPGGHQG